MIKGQNIFLIGPMGVGKTTIGKTLSKMMNLRFVDSDQVIEARAGASIPWIFDVEGEVGFRKREANVIEELTREQGIVLATGGGSVITPANRIALAARGIVIYLYAKVDELVERANFVQNRPILQRNDPRQVFEVLHQERESLYLEIADFSVDTSDGSPRTIAHRIINLLENE